MERYLIAGVTVEFDLKHSRLRRQAEPYRIKATDTPPDMSFSLTERNYARGREAIKGLDDDALEYLLYGFLFYDRLLDFDGIMLHASAVAAGGYAYLFTADSGVGKSTHTANWLKLLGDKAEIINDDKPAIRYINGEYYVFGTPFSGKTDLNVNRAVKLGAICFLSRGEKNSISTITPAESIRMFIKQTSSLEGADRIEKRLEYLDRLIPSVPLYQMQCINDVSAAKLAFDTMCRTVPVHIEEVADVITEKLLEGGTVNFLTRGKSMQPMLVGRRDSVMLASPGKIKKGDVVLFVNPEGKYLLHRIKKLTETTVTTKGDSLEHYDETVPRENVIGKVVSFTRKGKMISSNNLFYKVYSKYLTNKLGMKLLSLIIHIKNLFR